MNANDRQREGACIVLPSQLRTKVRFQLSTMTIDFRYSRRCRARGY